jgi:glycine betaine catabolism A
MAETVPMALSLPARYYIDPDYYRAELEWYFGAMWFYAGRADEVPGRGDYVLREVAGESLILVRGDRGELSAFFNVCRHRGTRLCEDASGSTGSTIRCPYHAWVYDLDGRLVGAPHMDRVEGFRLEDYPLARLAVDVWDGLVFVNFREHPEGSLKAQLGGVDDRFRPWGMGELRTARRIVYDVAANWKLIIHNYSECLHCPGVHPALQKFSHYLNSVNQPADEGYLGGRMVLREGVDTFSLDGRRRWDCLPGLDASECRYVYFYAVLPNLLLSPHPDYVMTHALWPRGVGRTEIVCELLFHPDAMAAADFDPEDVVAFWDVTNRQDWHVCEQMQIGLGSRAYRPGPYSHREDLLPAFDRLILEREQEAKREINHE